MKYDSPFKPITDFPGQQDGPGIYGKNPHLGPDETGEFKTKFYEDIESPMGFELDSPMETSDIAREKKTITITAGEAPKVPFSIDSPFVSLAKL